MIPKWVISDTHFFHNKLWEKLNPGCRPGSNGQLIIDSWRELVKDEDKILHLGDVFVGLPRKDSFLIPWLPGEKYLIPGNHDYGWKLEALQERGWKIIDPFVIKYRGEWIEFSHEKNIMLSGTDVINLHGHNHSGPAIEGNYINCTVDKIGFSPKLLDELLAPFID